MREDHPSETAATVGTIIAFTERHPELRALLPARAGAMTTRLMVAANQLPSWAAEVFGWPPGHQLIELIESLVAPGMLPHMAVRKRWIDDQVSKALSQGVRQVVVIGGGYDTLCARHAPRNPLVRFVELDHPATHKVKRDAMASLDWLAPNLSLVDVDLATEPLHEALERGGWDLDAPGVFIAEGLLMYLPEAEVSGLFRAVAACSASGSRFLFTYLPADTQGRPMLGPLGDATQWMLNLRGEPFLWSCAAHQLAGFVGRCQHTLMAHPDAETLRQRYFAPMSLDRPLGEMERLGFTATLHRR